MTLKEVKKEKTHTKLNKIELHVRDRGKQA